MVTKQSSKCGLFDKILKNKKKKNQHYIKTKCEFGERHGWTTAVYIR